MKTRIVTVLLILIAARSARAQNQTECKANDTICRTIAATRQLLADYRMAISGQIDRIQHGYAAVGQAAEQGRRAEVESVLRTDRLRRSELMTDDFIHRSRPIWHWKEYLLDYAAQDLKTNRELLELDSLDGSRFLQGVQNLEAEFSKAQALDQLLESLARKKSLLDNLKELASVGQDTKAEFDKLVCAGLKQDLADKTKAKAAASAAQAAVLQQAIDAITKERAGKSCKD